MVRITEVISAAFEWTRLMLFRPFIFKKWLILGFAALMAGALTGNSFRLNLPSSSNKTPTKQTEIKKETQGSPAKAAQAVEKTPGQVFQEARAQLKKPFVLAIVITIAVLLILLILLFTWLSSRFLFIFMEDVVKNDASIKIPFKANKLIGNSLFLFQIFFQCVSMFFLIVPLGFCFYRLYKLGIFTQQANKIDFKQVFLICLPNLLILLLAMIILGVIGLIVRDFVTIVMYKEKIKFLSAWGKAVAIFKANKFTLIKYMLVKFGLAIASGMIFGLINLMAIGGMMLPLIGIIGLGGLGYTLMPQALRVAYIIIAVIIGLPFFIALSYFFTCMLLPMGIFFRAFSLKFMARIAPQYNIFKLQTDQEV